VCGSCGAQCEAEERFCWQCGKPVAAAATSPAAAARDVDAEALLSASEGERSQGERSKPKPLPKPGHKTSMPSSASAAPQRNPSLDPGALFALHSGGI